MAAPATRAFTLALVGDLQLGRLVDEVLASRRLAPAAVWSDTLPILRSADCVLANLECALSRSNVRWSATPKAFHFRSDPDRGCAVLSAARVRGVTLANNHALDYEVQGMRDTLRALDAAGIARAGAGETLREAQQPGWVTVDVGGAPLRIALLSFADHPAEWGASLDEPGINAFDPFPSPDAMAWVRGAAERARADGASLIVAGAHYGGNYVLKPPQRVRGFWRSLLDTSEVDVVFGHSAHVAQGIEVHAGKLIVYQAGDFVDDYAKDPEWRNDWGELFIARFEAAGGRMRLAGVDAVPVVLDVACTTVARADGDAPRIARRLQSLSAELGTVLEADAAGVLRWRATSLTA